MLLFIGELCRSVGGELQADEFESAKGIEIGFGSDIGEKFAGGSCVPTDPVDAAFADFDAGRSELDQPLEESTNRGVSTRNSPEAFPFFVGFPVEPEVEVVETKQIIAIEVPAFVAKGSWAGTWWVFLAVTVTAGIADGMGHPRTGIVRVRRNRSGRIKTLCFGFCRDHTRLAPLGRGSCRAGWRCCLSPIS